MGYKLFPHLRFERWDNLLFLKELPGDAGEEGRLQHLHRVSGARAKPIFYELIVIIAAVIRL